LNFLGEMYLWIYRRIYKLESRPPIQIDHFYEGISATDQGP